MAEIEPGTGTPGTADQTVVVTPVTGSPAEPSGPPGAARPRPKGLVRWGVALLVLALTVGVVSVAAAFLAAGSSGSTIEGWLPKGTVAYLELRADLPGDQRAKVGDLLAKFPGFADQSSMDAKIDEALDKVLDSSGVSWSKDVKPWFGGEVGLAMTNALFDMAAKAGAGATPAEIEKLPADGGVAILSVKDGAAAKAFVGKQVGGTQKTETYAGGEITTVDGPGGASMAYAVRTGVLILGPEATVKAALDTGGNSPVPASPSFSAAQKTAPATYIGYGYLDVAAVTKAAMDAAAGQAALPKACLDTLTGSTPAWMAGSARADSSALIFEANAPATETTGATPKAGPSAVASHLPSSTVGAVEVRDLGQGLVKGYDALKTQLACDASLKAALDQVDQALSAIGGADALIGWAGDTAVAVTAKGTAAGGGLASVVADEAKANRAIDQIRALVALGGASAGLTISEESYGGGTLYIVTVPGSVAPGAEIPKIAVTVQKGIFVLGTVDFVKAVVDTDSGSSLASSDVYKRAISLAGGDGISDVFVDLTGVRAVAEAMMPAAEKQRYETEVKPFLVPLEAFASVGEAPGSTTVSRAVITFSQ